MFSIMPFIIPNMSMNPPPCSTRQHPYFSKPLSQFTASSRAFIFTLANFAILGFLTLQELSMKFNRIILLLKIMAFYSLFFPNWSFVVMSRHDHGYFRWQKKNKVILPFPSYRKGPKHQPEATETDAQITKQIAQISRFPYKK